MLRVVDERTIEQDKGPSIGIECSNATALHGIAHLELSKSVVPALSFRIERGHLFHISVCLPTSEPILPRSRRLVRLHTIHQRQSTTTLARRALSCLILHVITAVGCTFQANASRTTSWSVFPPTLRRRSKLSAS